MWYWLSLLMFVSLIPSAFAQTIEVNQTSRCFEDYDNYTNIFRNCGFEDDWLRASLLGFEWVTGGYFSFLIVAVLVIAVYLKYHKWIYPLMIGIAFIPYAWFVIPDVVVNYIFILLIVAGGGVIVYFMRDQLKEY